MSELKPRITENGIDYILVGDYYIPDLKLPEEHRPIGKYGRMHREYLREVHPARLNTLILTGEMWTYLADLNEQAQKRLVTIMEQMKTAEGVTEKLKRTQQMEWVQRCNSTTIQRETKMFLGADNEETAELTVPMYDFGDWASKMKAYRKKNHITQQELAQLMGVKHFTLRSWEQKQAKPPYNVWRLHKHLFDDSIKLT